MEFYFRNMPISSDHHDLVQWVFAIALLRRGAQNLRMRGAKELDIEFECAGRRLAIEVECSVKHSRDVTEKTERLKLKDGYLVFIVNKDALVERDIIA